MSQATLSVSVSKKRRPFARFTLSAESGAKMVVTIPTNRSDEASREALRMCYGALIELVDKDFANEAMTLLGAKLNAAKVGPGAS